MNTYRLAVAATVLLTLCGTAGAETMDKSKSDPFAVPVSGKGQTGERAAVPWTPERRAGAEATQTPDVDPAAARAAAGSYRSGGQAGPEGGTPAVLASAEAPMGAKAGQSGERSGEYWTGGRRAKAEATAKSDVDPAAARAASGSYRSSGQAGPEGGTPAVLASAEAPMGAKAGQSGERSGEYWTGGRRAKAEATAKPDVDPAAARSASGGFRSGSQGGPEGGTPAVLASAEAPMGAKAGQSGERSGEYWTGGRRAKAEATAKPDVDPAAARSASGGFRSGSQDGPEGGTPAMTVASGWEPIGSQVAPEGERKSNYWTPERLRKAKPLAIPTIPSGSDKPGAKNR